MVKAGTETNGRLERLEKETGRLRPVCFLQFVLLIAVGFTGVYNNRVHAQSGDHILHARGLVIEDRAGKPRILVLSAVPQSADEIPPEFHNHSNGVPG
jgi:hypothetical protein